MKINRTLTTNTEQVDKLSKIIKNLKIVPPNLQALTYLVNDTSALSLAIYTQNNTICEAMIIFLLKSRAFENVSEHTKILFREEILKLKREIREMTPDCEKVYW